MRASGEEEFAACCGLVYQTRFSIFYMNQQHIDTTIIGLLLAGCDVISTEYENTPSPNYFIAPTFYTHGFEVTRMCYVNP
jgi:hypothetical protein